MHGDQIRESFLQFFESKGHLRRPGSSLLPLGDRSLLFTNAGMVQFKPYFIGEMPPPQSRMVSCQKCFRTTDIELVGDEKHLTFFEMLGNFAVGDYFREEAIGWAWEFLIDQLKLSPNDLWVTVYEKDQDSYRFWTESIGIPAERVYRYNETSNWWGPPGSEGPCGPCTEIHFDRGAEMGCGPISPPESIPMDSETKEQVGCHPNCSRCGRFIELWNLVLMQFYQDTHGKRTPLETPNIDTGLGLERAAVILQQKKSIYETDLFAPIMSRISQLTRKEYGNDVETDYALRVVAEHGRSATFLIADGALPSNEGQGYVLRRVIRRGIRFGRTLSANNYDGEDRENLTLMRAVADETITAFSTIYPELASNRQHIDRILETEENRFREALKKGEGFLSGFVKIHKYIYEFQEKLLRDLKKPTPAIIRTAVHHFDGSSKYIKSSLNSLLTALSAEEMDGAHRADILLFQRLPKDEITSIMNKPLEQQAERLIYHIEVAKKEFEKDFPKFPASIAFLLHDTYGFPIELTEEICREYGFMVDLEGFDRELALARDRSKSTSLFAADSRVASRYVDLNLEATEFVGYEHLSQQSEIVGLLVDGKLTKETYSGDIVQIVIRQTPFYPEGGGQIGDSGHIIGELGRVTIEDTRVGDNGIIVHQGIVSDGVLRTSQLIQATVDPIRRMQIAMNHTTTHLLHAALRKILGDHVKQSGSLVADDRLRFDFSHPKGLSKRELLDVENLINDNIRFNSIVVKSETTYTEAIRSGAIAFFGEKYGDRVRIVEMGEGGSSVSREVCGGTHIGATGQIGFCHIIAENGIGGGIRRIEAVTGRSAQIFLRERDELVTKLGKVLRTEPREISDRIDNMMQELGELRKQLKKNEQQNLLDQSKTLMEHIEDINGIKVLAVRVLVGNIEGMRDLGDYFRQTIGSGLAMLGAVLDGQPKLLVTVTKDLVTKGFHAGELIKRPATLIGGGGGGNPMTAQAGGNRSDKLDQALDTFTKIIREREVIS